MTKFSTKKNSEKQVVDEETLSHEKACKECYKQKQRLINGDDQDNDDEVLVRKKKHAIIVTSRTEQEITNCFLEQNKK